MRGHADGLDGRVARRLEEPHLLLRQQRDLYVLAPAAASVRESLSALPDAFSGASRRSPMGSRSACRSVRRHGRWRARWSPGSRSSSTATRRRTAGSGRSRASCAASSITSSAPHFATTPSTALRWSPRRSFGWSAIATRRTPRASPRPSQHAPLPAAPVRHAHRARAHIDRRSRRGLARPARGAPARCAQSRPRGLTPRAAVEAPFSGAASGSCAPRAASDSHATCSRTRSSTVSWKTSGRL